MQELKNNISNESTGISEALETIDGQMTFFSHLIDEMEQYPDITAKFMQHGKVQNQLNAIYYLIHTKIEQIHKHQNAISNMVNKNASVEG